MDKAKEKMCAVAFGSDGFYGDSAFSVSDVVDADDGSPLEECLAAHRSLLEAEEGEDFEEESYEAPVGFWLLRPSDLRTAEVVYDADYGGSDRESYTCNRAAKHVCAHLAVKVLGTFPAEADEADEEE